jgi:hypothetical protein
MTATFALVLLASMLKEGYEDLLKARSDKI